MPKAKTKYPEIQDIKKDAQSLKENIATLKDHAVDDIKTNGAEKYEEIREAVSERVTTLNDSSQEQIQRAETYIKDKPLKSVGIAFAAGLALSMLLGRR